MIFINIKKKYIKKNIMNKICYEYRDDFSLTLF